MSHALQILVVEREPLIALDVERAVLSIFQDMAAVSLAMPAESLAIDRMFDLVVCDRDMAAEVLMFWQSRIRESGGALVFTTSADSNEIVAETWPVVRKPFQDEDLATAVRLALASRGMSGPLDIGSRGADSHGAGACSHGD